ncbi:hypothetical protein IFM89_000931 [Coptis chinensis]|uniref:Disease resistance protein n=1 Tax=Coptis chinensis TaxID=261450 RepID=A0A835MC37_9MAGN|nr:hypothetical protein IFM89_000931 [Coptis chinensis]
MPSLEKWYPGNENRREELFPCLKSLFIEHCPKLESLPFLPCLQHLTLSGCTETVITSLRSLSTLSSLVISWSSEMLSFPGGLLRNLSALETLEIRSCYGLHSIPDEIEYLTAVTSLKLIECGDLVVLPKRLQLLSSLKSFTIQSCNILESFPAMGIQGMSSSIVVLDIVYCNNLISLSEGLRYLSSLETLIIGVCTQLEFSREDFQHLISLRRLQLDSLTMLISIPDMQNLTALQYFVINNCENLWIIPEILGLTALQSLKIYRCKNLRMLPEGLQHLTYLHSLEIFKCHLHLHERVKEKGEDWPKIFHIQNLSIGP